MTGSVILVVEDDPVLRMVTAKQLSKLGYNSQSVSSGEEAVARNRDDVALIFMDIGLPGIDGIAAAIMIRQKELETSQKRVPIIALTAHSEKERCILAGIDDFLQKPALLADLKALLDKWLPLNGNVVAG